VIQEESMRYFALIFSALLAATSAALSAAAPAAVWTEYLYLDKGVAIQFPARPTVSTANYPSILVKGLKADVYSLTFDNVQYKLTAVDLAGHNEAGVNFVNEAAYNLMREGEVIFTDFPRVYQDEKSVFGVTLVFDRPDGRRQRTSLYYNKGRLYLADAIVLPARGDKDMTTPSRFDQTIRFPPDGRFDK